jgi:hypothetical protein
VCEGGGPGLKTALLTARVEHEINPTTCDFSNICGNIGGNTYLNRVCRAKLPRERDPIPIDVRTTGNGGCSPGLIIPPFPSKQT